MKDRCKAIYKKMFYTEPDIYCYAPGRVNLIGEHTDYNGGNVFPCAINLGIYCAAGKRHDKQLHFYSGNFPQDKITSTLDSIYKTGNWSDYVNGVIRTFESFGYPLNQGMNIVFFGDLPDGAGLSSSAAIEVLTGFVIKELFNIPVTAQEIALIGQFAENRYIGVNCGIMDQFTSAMGKKEKAVMLNSFMLEYSYAPLPSDKVSVVIVNSGVRHSLASSAYNERRSQCDTALSMLKKSADISCLCDMDVSEFEKYSENIYDPICLKRANHVIRENSRTIAAAKALNDGDLYLFGKLMNQSHLSLRDDYEVSCPELDFLAETAWKTDGVYGARMTGGGFGGCTVNLVKKDFSDKFSSEISNAYYKKFSIKPDIYNVQISDGVHLL